MTRQELQGFLKTYEVTYSQLAKEAGVGHFSLRRYLHDSDTGMSTKTVEKLQAAMYRIASKKHKSA